MNSRLPSAFLIVISAGFFLSLQNQVKIKKKNFEMDLFLQMIRDLR